jgi:phage-related minor tail protein
MENLVKQTEGTERAAERLGMTFASSFESAITSGQNFSEVLRGIAQDMIRIVARLTVTEPLAKGISGLFKSSGASQAASGLWDWLFSGIPGKASGGSVSAGSPYIVGERGPELFIPGQSGTISPNGAGGTYYIDARGADREGLARLESMIVTLNGTVESRAVAAVADAKMRGSMGNLFR